MHTYLTYRRPLQVDAGLVPLADPAREGRDPQPRVREVDPEASLRAVGVTVTVACLAVGDVVA